MAKPRSKSKQHLKKAVGLNVNIQADFAGFEAALKGVPTDINRQFAVALTRIAQAGKQAAKDGFDKNYIMRNTFMRGSIISTRAIPSQLSASVGTVSSLMALHLFGGTKKGNVAVKGIRGDDKRGRVTRALTVDSLLKKATTGDKSHKFFKKEVKGRTYIMAKTGGTHARVRSRGGFTGPVFDREPIVPMWLLRDGKPIKIKADWRLQNQVQGAMQDEAPAIMQAVIEDAWNHAREKGRI